MIANYGYKDGSGEYFIILDTDKCDGCGKCVEACPASVLEIVPNDFDPIEGGIIASVTEAQRKKIKYTCMPCKPVSGERKLPCVVSCPTEAISHSW
jgi:NAD-dependent dihydropyrimidine dehydrogenase PreA subunit